MDKNENGYPVRNEKCRCSCCMSPDAGNGGANNGAIAQNHACGGDGSCLDRWPVAYVYAPNQFFRMLYSAEDALKHGTLFEELYKPMEVYGRE